MTAIAWIPGQFRSELANSHQGVGMPRPIIALETFLMPSSSVPDEIKAKLTFNGTAGTLYSYGTTGLQAGQALRFALRADATGLATGR